MLNIRYAYYWDVGDAPTKASGKFGISIFIEGNTLYYDVVKISNDVGHTRYPCRCVKDI